MAVIYKRKLYFISCTIIGSIHLLLINSFDQQIFANDKDIADNTESGRLKYILQWTKSYNGPIKFMGLGQRKFVEGNCSIQNCVVTANKELFPNITDFDVILFHAPELFRHIVALPENRSDHQKFVFVSLESAYNYPTCSNKYNGYFNWTWTYKLNSDLDYRYMIIRNKNNEIVGPKEVMHWINLNDMEPINEELKVKLSTKKAVAAWFVSKCNTRNGRRYIGEQMQKELAKYNMTIDIYGRCGKKRCHKNNMVHCLRMIETDYYFYLSFENTFSDDYVTEKLLHALKQYTVPVVFGGANYTRFMPDGIYIDVRILGVKQSVSKMIELMKDKDKYYDYFKWHNHYSYHYPQETPETDNYCKLCSKINDDKLMAKISRVDDLQKWWNPKRLWNNACLNRTYIKTYHEDPVKIVKQLFVSLNSTDHQKIFCQNYPSDSVNVSEFQYLKIIYNECAKYRQD